MIKCKTFREMNEEILEKAISEWLTKNQEITIISTNLSDDGENYGFVLIYLENDEKILDKST